MSSNGFDPQIIRPGRLVLEHRLQLRLRLGGRRERRKRASLPMHERVEDQPLARLSHTGGVRRSCFTRSTCCTWPDPHGGI